MKEIIAALIVLVAVYICGLAFGYYILGPMLHKAVS